MVLLALQFKADLENLANVSLEESTPFDVKVKCSNCQESKEVVVSPTEEFAIDGSRGTCQFKMKCKMCERVGNIVITAKDGKETDAKNKSKSTPKEDDDEHAEVAAEDDASDEKSKKKGVKKNKSSKKKSQQDNTPRFTYNKKASGTFATVVIMDCRGMEVVSWAPKGGWSATGVNTPTTFKDISLADEFFDYDEEASKEVSIQAIETKVSKA